MSLDFRAAVISALDNLLASEVIETLIAKALEKTIATVIDNELRTYSKFGERIAEAVKKSLALHGDLDLPSYNDAVLKIVRAQVEHQTNAVLQQQVAARLAELLTPAPESIKLSELAATYLQHVKEHHRSGGCVCYGEEEYGITCRIIDKERGDFKEIFFADEPGVDGLYGSKGISISTHAGKVYHLRFGNADVEKQMFVGPLYGFERMLFQMHAAGSKIIYDVDEVDIETRFELTEA